LTTRIPATIGASPAAKAASTRARRESLIAIA
jgi:hypothetical protein